MHPRIIYWSEETIDFRNPPNVRIPDAEELRKDVGQGREWNWLHKGMVGILTLPVLRNALAIYDDFNGAYPRQTAPPHVGKLLWSQTTPLKQTEQLTQPSPSPTPKSSSEDH